MFFNVNKTTPVRSLFCSSVLLLTGLFSCYTQAASLRSQQQQYVKHYQQQNGDLVAAPPVALGQFLSAHAMAASAAKSVTYNTLTTRAGLASITKSYVTSIDKMAAVIDDDVDLHGRRIPTRIYLPKSSDAAAKNVIFFIHGGGHLSGSVEVYDPIARHLAAATNNIVVAVDYRRAPENPYPAGLNDAKEVLLKAYPLLQQHHIAFHRRLTLIGDSGGGAFSATIAQDLQKQHPKLINRLVLIYPSLDYTLSWPSVKENGKGKLLDESKVAWYFDQYFQHGESRHAISPLYRPVGNLFPPTLVFSGGLDPLRDEDFAFVAKLKAAGVAVQHQHFPSMIHAYLMLEDLVPSQAQQTYHLINQFIQSHP